MACRLARLTDPESRIASDSCTFTNQPITEERAQTSHGERPPAEESEEEGEEDEVPEEEEAVEETPPTGG